MIHINKFLERLQGFEARGAKDFIMSVRDAKDLHTDITRLLMALETARDQAQSQAKDEVVQVEMDGGQF